MGDMETRNAHGSPQLRVRDRLVLRVVDRHECRGFVVSPQQGAPAYRGSGGADYACGTCGSLLAIGVRPRMFLSFVFACACGALNAVE
jgi:hypothetical protein